MKIASRADQTDRSTCSGDASLDLPTRLHKTGPDSTAEQTATEESEPMNADTLQTVWAPRVLSILRIVAALIFMEHGTQKLLGFPPLDRPAPERDVALLGSRGARAVRRRSAGARAVHPPGGVRAVWRDGVRLLDGARAAELLPRRSTAAMPRSSTASCSFTWLLPAAAPGAWTIPCGNAEHSASVADVNPIAPNG